MRKGGKGWNFPGKKSRTTNLVKYGCDYSLHGYLKLIRVERKEIGDLLKCITTDWDRFLKNQVRRLLGVQFPLIIVEGRMWTRSKFTQAGPKAISARVAYLEAMGLPVAFCCGPSLAEHHCVEFFHNAISLLELR